MAGKLSPQTRHNSENLRKGRKRRKRNCCSRLTCCGALAVTTSRLHRLNLPPLGSPQTGREERKHHRAESPQTVRRDLARLRPQSPQTGHRRWLMILDCLLKVGTGNGHWAFVSPQSGRGSPVRYAPASPQTGRCRPLLGYGQDGQRTPPPPFSGLGECVNRSRVVFLPSGRVW
jgi:hypothetical protein